MSNQTKFFAELDSNISEILGVLDTETYTALTRLVSSYREGDTVQTLIKKLGTSKKAQKHLCALIKALTEQNKDEDEDDNDDDDNNSEEKPLESRGSLTFQHNREKPDAHASEMMFEREGMSVYRADLLKDVTLEQKNTILGCDEKHVKVWRFRNSSPTRWPQGCKFVSLDGMSKDDVITFQLHPIATNPGQVADAGFQFRTPKEPGSYVFKYALASPGSSGLMTAEPLTLSFTVTDDPEKLAVKKLKSKSREEDKREVCSSGQKKKEKEVQQKQQPPPPLQHNAGVSIEANDVEMTDSKVDECIATLVSMGFGSVDKKSVEALMIKHNGDVMSIVDELLQ